MTRESGRQARHSFSFGAFHDPDRLAFGPLVALNDELLGPGLGYDAHAHADVTILTWVVLGALRHTDDDGATTQPAGSVSVTRAGAGYTHAEHADGVATRFVSLWLRPDETGGTGSRTVTTLPSSGGVTQVADSEALGVAGAGVAVADLAANETFTLPDSPRVYAFVVTGALARSSLAEPLAAGDASEITDESGLPVTATVPTRLLVCSLP